MTWRLRLLGQFELSGPDGPVALQSAKLTALLAYLAVVGRPVLREQITALLWGSHFEEQARQNVRQALVRLRKIVGSDVLVPNEAALQLAPGSMVCDAVDFMRLVSSGTTESLSHAVSMLDGEFLTGIDIAEPQFEEWLAAERRRYDKLACEALALLAEKELDGCRLIEALLHAEACIARDNLREDAHRTAMRALFGLGRRNEALRLFHELAARLRKELGTEPEAATVKIFESLRQPDGSSFAGEATVSLPSASARPSIAVLPFVNLSHDPEQDFFAEGICEDLIAEISRFRSLFVISRNSSFSFKGSNAAMQEVSARLGARYIVDGSVRRAGNLLRVSAKLVDSAGDSTIWAGRYDRPVEDIFTVQDEVVQSIVSAIDSQLLANEWNRALRKPPESLDAWEAYHRGLWHVFRYRREDREQALALFRRSIALDPRFASAHAGLSLALYVYVLLGCSADRDDDLRQGVAAARMAIELDEYDPHGYASLARCCIMLKRPADALAASDKAIQLSPNFARAHFGRGHSLWHQGRPGEAISSIDEAIRLSPCDPTLWAFMASRSIALVLSGAEEQAVDWSRRAQQQNNAAIFAHVGELCALGLMGRAVEAADAVARAKATMQDVCVTFLDEVLPITDAGSRERFLQGLKKSGLPS